MKFDKKFRDHAKLIDWIANKFTLRYPKAYADWEDARGDARLFFLEACKKHDPEKSKLSTWCSNYIWLRMLEQLRRKYRYENTGTIGIKEEHAQYTGGLHHLLLDLSHDATAIVHLILDTPGFVFRSEEIKARDNSPLILLYRTLRRIGWQRKKIIDSFCEIIEALND